MPGKIKMTIEPNGAVSLDMSGFKKCADKTKKLLNELEMDSTDIRLKEEEVKTVQTSNKRVHVNR